MRNYPKNWSHLQESVFLFRKLAFSLVNSLGLVYLERYCARQTSSFPESLSGGPPYSEGDIVLTVFDSI